MRAWCPEAPTAPTRSNALSALLPFLNCGYGEDDEQKSANFSPHPK